MPNTVTSTGVVTGAYNSRGLITEGFNNQPAVRQSNGDLFVAVIKRDIKNVRIYRSTDEGFSWDQVWISQLQVPDEHYAEINGPNITGPVAHIQIFESANRLLLWLQYYDVTLARFDVEVFVFELDTMERLTDTGTDFTSSNEVIIIDSDGSFLAPYHQSRIYLSFVKDTVLNVKEYMPTFQVTSLGSSTLTGPFYNLFSAVAHEDGYVDYLVCGTTGIGNHHISHARYVQNVGFGSLHTVSDFLNVDDMRDLDIARDIYGTLCATWGRTNTAGTDVDIYYSISTDAGVTWSTPAAITRTAGHSVYQDAVTGVRAVRSTALGGFGGFLLSYVRNNSSIVPKTYVRALATSDGSTYTLGDEALIGREIVPDEEAVVGLRWFQPPGGSLLNLDDPGLVRVAYQIGEGNSPSGLDTIPVRFGQELLRSSAFQETFSVEENEYVIDPVGDTDLLVLVNVLGGPSDNVDYYAEGLTGYVTDRYLSAFEKVGTEIRIFQYEPLTYAQMDDRSAYASPIEHSTLAVIDPQTYEFPLADKGSESYSDFVERDVRKVYFPPDFHLSRSFVVNGGNFLKRTVWTFYYDGNEYEVSQVVPYFLEGQIAYYNANAYVVGPSNNPFSRRTLPSET